MSEKQKILLAKLLKNCVNPDGSIDGEVLKVLLDDDSSAFEKESGINLDDFVLIPKDQIVNSEQENEVEVLEKKVHELEQQLINGFTAMTQQNNVLGQQNINVANKVVQEVVTEVNKSIIQMQKNNLKEVEKIVQENMPDTQIRLS